MMVGEASETFENWGKEMTEFGVIFQNMNKLGDENRWIFIGRTKARDQGEAGIGRDKNNQVLSGV